MAPGALDTRTAVLDSYEDQRLAPRACPNGVICFYAWPEIRRYIASEVIIAICVDSGRSRSHLRPSLKAPDRRWQPYSPGVFSLAGVSMNDGDHSAMIAPPIPCATTGTPALAPPEVIQEESSGNIAISTLSTRSTPVRAHCTVTQGSASGQPEMEAWSSTEAASVPSTLRPEDGLTDTAPPWGQVRIDAEVIASPIFNLPPGSVKT